MIVNNKKNYTKSFIAWVYASFWISLVISGALMITFDQKIPMQLFYTVGSWTPTLVLLIMFKKLISNTSRRDYFKKLFEAKINWRMLLTVSGIQLFVVFASIFIISLQKGVPTLNMLNLSIPILSYAFFTSLITGATGEEAAWRGYLFPIMTKESGLIKGSIFLGLIWGVWHTPLWFFTSGFYGLDLVVYIIAFMVAIVAISVIIGICYNHNKNLVVPIWIHLLYNFSVSLYDGRAEDLVTFFLVFTSLYVLTAFAFYIWYKKTTKDKKMGGYQ